MNPLPFFVGCVLATQILFATPAFARPPQSGERVRAEEELLGRARKLLEEARAAEERGDSPTARTKSVEAIDALLAAPEASTAEAGLEILGDLAWIAGRTGDSEAGVRAARHVLDVRTRTLPDDALGLQRARLDLAGILHDRRDLKRARELTERALAILESTVAEDHVERLRARYLLGAHQVGLNEYKAARVTLEGVLAVRAKTLPAEHEDVLRTKRQLAICLGYLGELEASRVLFQEIHDVYERTVSDDHRHLRIARGSMAWILDVLGDYEGARRYAEKVYEAALRTMPEDSRDLQEARHSVAVARKRAGDLQGARELQELVIASMSRTLPPDHRDVLKVRDDLAKTLEDLGEFAAAREILEQVVEVMARSYAADDPDLLFRRIRLGGVLRRLGDLQGADRLEADALRGLERVLPSGHIQLAYARANHAITAGELRDYLGARVLEERVVATLEKALPKDHPDVNRARGQLATTLRELGDAEGAQSLWERALTGFERTPPGAIVLAEARINYSDVLGAREAVPVLEKALRDLSKALPAEHPTLRATRQRLAWRRQQMGDLLRARQEQEALLDLWSKGPIQDVPMQIGVQADLASTLRRLGEVGAARDLCESALDAAQRALPPGDALLQRLRLRLAMTLAGEAALAGASTPAAPDGARAERCAQLLRAAADAEIESLRQVLMAGSGREVEEIAADQPVVVSDLLSFARGYGVFAPRQDLVEAAFLLSETTRGAAVQAADVARRAAGSPEYAAARAAWRAASADLARLAQSGAKREAFEAARTRREEAERALVALAREVAGVSATGASLDPARLRGHLGPKTALVAFRRYSDWRVDKRATTEADSPSPLAYTWRARLGAFVVRGGGEATPEAPPVAFVDLGPRKDVREAIEVWRAAVLGGRERGLAAEAGARDLRAPGETVRRLVLDPLAPALAGVERLVVVLDDVLHLVPLDALPLADSDQRVGDRWSVEMRVSSSELLAHDPPRAAGTLVALGGASFNLQPLELSAEEAELVAKERPTSVAAVLRGTSWERGFEPLTYTATEARGVAALFEEAHGDAVRPLVLERRKASRSALLEAAAGGRFLHVATHGWYAPESIRSWADEDAEGRDEASTLRLEAGEKVRRMNPMLLSGLALAGANLPEDGAGRAPGLLTAEELSALDLSGCELAVLSACDTNVGERRIGQGVASFQRALHMAGARSVITSLWKVPDEATKELMLDFYRRLWVERRPKHEALWAAKQRLREARDEDGSPKYAERDWAGWVLTGQPD